MGSILGCRSAALAIAAGLTLGRSPFLKVMPPRGKNPNYKGKQRDDEQEEDPDKQKEDMRNQSILEKRSKLFKLVGNSDHAMLAAVYDKWDSTNGNNNDVRKYCDNMGLNGNGMRDMRTLVKQYDGALSSLGFSSGGGGGRFSHGAGPSSANANGHSWRAVRACVVAALAPHQLVRVQRPSAKYAETSEGAVAKDVNAKEVRFFVRASDVDANANGSGSGIASEIGVQAPAKGYKTTRYHDIPEEQVFLHPSSNCFATGVFSCPWLVYHELVRTSKPFLRDATEASSYALLLFGGSLDIQASKGTIVVDHYVRLAASPRIGALIGGLRSHMDALLEQKVANPQAIDMASSDVMTTVVQLIVSDGLGKV
jgi:ATP-dependent RNA helicase DHX57